LAIKCFVVEINIDNLESAYVLRFLLDSEMNFYRNNFEQDHPLPITNEEWRAKLKEGDMTDSVKEEPKLIGWSPAKILQITEKNALIQFIGEGNQGKK